MKYLTYEAYLSMGGTLDISKFDDLEFEAESYVDWYTFNRLQNEEEIPERVQKCMYHIIKLMQDEMSLMNGETGSGDSSAETGKQILSQSNDGVSISYNVISAKDALDLTKDKVDLSIKRYLQGVSNSLGRKLLYRGIYPDE